MRIHLRAIYHFRKTIAIIVFTITLVCIVMHVVSKNPFDNSAHYISPQYKAVVFNRVPKCGSTSIVRIFEKLKSKNDFKVLRINSTHPLQFQNSYLHNELVHEVSGLLQSSNLFLHGHFYFINFHSFGSLSSVVYINCVRDPLERLISKYYFVRFGDDHRPNHVRSRMKDVSVRSQTFDDCVKTAGEDCDPSLLWVQLPFFCGYAAYCHIPGNRAALETAKRRLVEDYLLVGSLDQFDKFMQLLGQLLPDFLSGLESTANLKINGEPLWHLRKTRHKITPLPETIAFFQRNPIWQVEQEFYDFAKTEFMSKYRKSMHYSAGSGGGIWGAYLFEAK